jgi:hypothetical protein
MKTESVAEFLARGGKIKIGKPNQRVVRKYVEKPEGEVTVTVEDDIDYSLLPEGLKIALGIKE